MKTKGKGRKGMHGMGRKGMHGMGLMKGLGFLKSASKALKKGLKKKNVKKLLNRSVRLPVAKACVMVDA